MASSQQNRRPYLVQRVLKKRHQNDSKGVDRHFSFDYMGSAEFEFGALPRALKAMRARKSVIIKLMHAGYNVWFVGHEALLTTARAYFTDQMQPIPSHRTLECSNLRESMTTDDKFYTRCIGWWCVDEDTEFVLFKSRADADLWAAEISKEVHRG